MSEKGHNDSFWKNQHINYQIISTKKNGNELAMNMLRMEIGRLLFHLSREVLAQPSNKERIFFLREFDNFMH